MKTLQDSITTNLHEAEWSEWIHRIAMGDEGSLEKLYEATAVFVYTVALRITGLPAVAEEVTENVFFQVWRTAKSFDPERGSPLTWLFVICRSHSLSQIRNSDIAVCYSDMEALIETCEEQESDPQSLIMAMQKNTCLHLALQRLDCHERQLLTLAFFRDLTYSEIADRMTMPLGTVKTTIRRALQKLRYAFELIETRGEHARF